MGVYRDVHTICQSCIFTSMLNYLFGYPINLVMRCLQYLGALTTLFFKTIFLIFVPPFKGRRILKQAMRVGPGTMFISSLVALFVGMIMALQMAYQMKEMSAEIYIPSIVAVSLTRELAPVLTALIVAGRMGAGIAAEIGSMTVTDQVNALRAFAVNPVKYLVVPRFLAMVIMLPLLTVFADIIGIIGGAIICIFKLFMSPEMYYTMMVQSLQVKDIVTGLLKTVCFGVIIALVGCYQGLKVEGGADGVGKATTSCVVITFILIIITDCLFTTMLYFVFHS